MSDQDLSDTIQFDVFEAAWQRLVHADGRSEDMPDPAGVRHGDLRRYFETTHPVTGYDLTSLSDEDERKLADLGIRKSRIEKIFFSRNKDEIEFLRDHGVDAGALAHPDTYDVCHYHRYQNHREALSYQDGALQAGFVFAPSLFRDKVTLKTNQSFVFLRLGLLVTFYRFVDDGRVFFLVCSSAHGEKLALYIPGIETIIKVKPFNSHGWDDLARTVAEFKATMIGHGKAAFRTLEYPSDQSRLITGVVCHHSIGHFYWNHLSGVQRLVDSGQIDSLNRLIVGPVNFMDFESIFNDLDDVDIQTVPTLEGVVKASFQDEGLKIFTTDRCAREGLAQRMHRVARETLAVERQQELQRLREAYDLVIWVTLRVGRRRWLSQVEGLGHIFNKLTEDYGKVLCVFDGYTAPSSLNDGELDRAVWNAFDKAVGVERDVADEIAQGFNDQVGRLDVIGATPEEKIVLLESTDFFIAPFGSGAVWTSWIGKMPGVYHINSNATSSFREIVNYREDGPDNPYIASEHITNENDSGQIHISYDFSWQVVYDELIKLMNKHRS